MIQRCLLIADDLTGGADAGAQFSKRNLSTLLLSGAGNAKIDLARYQDSNVLVINTDSRALSPDEAYTCVSSVLKDYKRKNYHILFKKIDSTLRGNIGYEIDAILQETGILMAFMAPSFPEQDRIVIGGILVVKGRPLSLTEVSSDVASPVVESHVQKRLMQQSSHKVGHIDLTHVASSSEQLQKAVEREKKKRNRIIIFDAVRTSDLVNIAEVAFCMENKPLLIGSAGLAKAVAKKLSPPKLKKNLFFIQEMAHSFGHVFVISGSASRVTHEQLKRIEQMKKIPSFQLIKSFLNSGKEGREKQGNDLSYMIGASLAQGHAILKTCPERILPKDFHDYPIHVEIARQLGHIAKSTLAKSKIDMDDLAVIIIGGDTAMNVINCLGAEGMEIRGEIMDGIVMGHVLGGSWAGLNVVTKAGAFGKENALEIIINALENGTP